MTFLTGFPALYGVYNDDTDHVGAYALSGGAGAVLVTMLTSSRDYMGLRPKLVAALLGTIPGLGMGLFATMGQKYDVYIHYDNYKARWRKVDPMWMDYAEREEARSNSESAVSPVS